MIFGDDLEGLWCSEPLLTIIRFVMHSFGAFHQIQSDISHVFCSDSHHSVYTAAKTLTKIAHAHTRAHTHAFHRKGHVETAGAQRAGRDVEDCVYLLLLHVNIRFLFIFLVLNDEGRVRRTSSRGICSRSEHQNPHTLKTAIIGVEEFLLAPLFS